MEMAVLFLAFKLLLILKRVPHEKYPASLLGVGYLHHENAAHQRVSYINEALQLHVYSVTMNDSAANMPYNRRPPRS